MLDQRPQTPETIVIRSLAHAVKQRNAVTTLTSITKKQPKLTTLFVAEMRCNAHLQNRMEFLACPSRTGDGSANGLAAAFVCPPSPLWLVYGLSLVRLRPYSFYAVPCILGSIRIQQKCTGLN